MRMNTLRQFSLSVTGLTPGEYLCELVGLGLLMWAVPFIVWFVFG